MAEKAYKKEMYMYQRGLSEVLPESLGKRLSAIQANLKEENKEEDAQKDMLELRAVVKGKILHVMTSRVEEEFLILTCFDR